MRAVKIELLYAGGCPGWQLTGPASGWHSPPSRMP